MLRASRGGILRSYSIARLDLDFDNHCATAEWTPLDTLDGRSCFDECRLMACNNRVNTYLACISSIDSTRLHFYTFDSTAMQVASPVEIECAKSFGYRTNIHYWQNYIFIVADDSYRGSPKLIIDRYNILTKVKSTISADSVKVRHSSAKAALLKKIRRHIF